MMRRLMVKSGRWLKRACIAAGLCTFGLWFISIPLFTNGRFEIQYYCPPGTFTLGLGCLHRFRNATPATQSPTGWRVGWETIDPKVQEWFLYSVRLPSIRDVPRGTAYFLPLWFPIAALGIASLILIVLDRPTSSTADGCCKLCGTPHPHSTGGVCAVCGRRWLKLDAVDRLEQRDRRVRNRAQTPRWIRTSLRRLSATAGVLVYLLYFGTVQLQFDHRRTTAGQVEWTIRFANHALLVVWEDKSFQQPGSRFSMPWRHGDPSPWYPMYTYTSPGAISGPTIISVNLPMWSLCASILLPSMALFWRYRPFPRGYCQQCGYNLTGNVSGICPECGGPVEVQRP